MDLCSLSQLLDDLKSAEDYLKKECGLTYKEASMLCSIDKGFNEPAKLAKKLELSPSRTSRLISSLEIKGITLREASKKDKRIICLKLSDKGNGLLCKIRETKLNYMKRSYGRQFSVLICLGELFRWSSPRITCINFMSISSTTTDKLYVGDPSERAIIKSSSSVFWKVTSPLILSFTVTAPYVGFLKRTTALTPSGGCFKSRQRPS